MNRAADFVTCHDAFGRDVVTVHVAGCDTCSAWCCRMNTPLDPYEHLGGWYWTEEHHGMIRLRRNPDGSCCYLVDNRCSIYGFRPLICREYSCDGRRP